MATKFAFPPDITKLGPLERRRKISVAAAADFNDVHESTFRRRYGHLIKRVGKRKQAVELGDAIDLPPPQG
jgi:hypothetical protein